MGGARCPAWHQPCLASPLPPAALLDKPPRQASALPGEVSRGRNHLGLGLVPPRGPHRSLLPAPPALTLSAADHPASLLYSSGNSRVEVSPCWCLQPPLGKLGGSPFWRHSSGPGSGPAPLAGGACTQPALNSVLTTRACAVGPWANPAFLGHAQPPL